MRMRWPTVASVLVHVAAVAALLLASFWRLEKVQAKYTPLVFMAGVAPPPPAPPPPPPAGGSLSGKVKPKPRVTKDLTQPVQVERRALEAAEPPAAKGGVQGGEEGGEEGGQVGGQIGGSKEGVLGGILGGVGTAAPPAAPEAPRVVPAVLIEGGRIAGNAQIQLPEATKQIMSAQSIPSLDVAVKLCLSDAGAPSSIELKKPSGFAELDQKIEREMRAWRYRPYQVNSKPVPVCTAIIFRYRLR